MLLDTGVIWYKVYCIYVIEKYVLVDFQVVDEFYVRRTKDLKDSISYLTIMTRYLQSVYSVSLVLKFYTIMKCVLTPTFSMWEYNDAWNVFVFSQRYHNVEILREL